MMYAADYCCGGTPMYLLVIITRQEDKTYDFLKLLPTVGVRGATVIEGRGMGKILRDRETIFTSIEQILSASIDLTDNVVILSLVEGGEVPVSYTHLRAHETRHDLVCRL